MADLIIGSGYLGSALADDLLREGRRVVALDNGFSTDLSLVERLGQRGDFRLLRGDVRSLTDVEDAFSAAAPVEAVYLLAAQASAHDDAAAPEYTEEVNLRGPRLVLEAVLRHGGPPVVYGSSFHVYGPQTPSTDIVTVDEGCAYGVQRDLSHLSKVYAEKLCELFAVRHDLRAAPVRLGVVYGVGPVMKRDRRFMTVPHAFALRAARGETLQVHESGLAPLGFVHLADAVAALRLAARPVAQHYAPANAVSEVASAADVAAHVRAAAAEAGLGVRVETPSEPPRGSLLAPSRLEALGWRPARRLAETARELLAYFLPAAAGVPGPGVGR